MFGLGKKTPENGKSKSREHKEKNKIKEYYSNINNLYSPELLKEEKEALENVYGEFYLIQEKTEEDYLSIKRIEISRKWATKLIKAALIFNILSILCFILTIVIVLKKPGPEYYATTPYGKVYHLEKLKK